MQNLHARYRDSLPCISMNDMLFYFFFYNIYLNLNIVALFLKNCFNILVLFFFKKKIRDINHNPFNYKKKTQYLILEFYNN